MKQTPLIIQRSLFMKIEKYLYSSLIQDMTVSPSSSRMVNVKQNDHGVDRQKIEEIYDKYVPVFEDPTSNKPDDRRAYQRESAQNNLYKSEISRSLFLFKFGLTDGPEGRRVADENHKEKKGLAQMFKIVLNDKGLDQSTALQAIYEFSEAALLPPSYTKELQEAYKQEVNQSNQSNIEAGILA